MIFDLHTDLPTADIPRKKKFDFIQSNKNNVITLAVFTTRLEDPLSFIKSTVETYSEFENARFAIEDSWFVTPENMFAVSSLPLLYCTLAWGGDNALAGGHKGSGGLTRLGKEFVKCLNKAGIAVDTAHLNEKSFYDVLELGAKVLCSHTCLYSEFPHTRNLKDEQIRELISAGGITGIAAVSDFMGKDLANKHDYAAQFCRYADKFGVESLSVGTDFFGTEPLEGLETYKDVESLTCELIKSGFTIEETDKIYFQNAKKFYDTTGDK